MRCERTGGAPAAVLLPSVLALAACASLFATKIADIQREPGRFDGRAVTVVGTVTAAHNLLILRYYEVDDGTGRIKVVTQSALPNEGDKVTVKGRVSQAFAIGEAHFVVIVEPPPAR